jgi:hypothetical protein
MSNTERGHGRTNTHGSAQAHPSRQNLRRIGRPIVMTIILSCSVLRQCFIWPSVPTRVESCMLEAGTMPLLLRERVCRALDAARWTGESVQLRHFSSPTREYHHLNGEFDWSICLWRGNHVILSSYIFWPMVVCQGLVPGKGHSLDICCPVAGICMSWVLCCRRRCTPYHFLLSLSGSEKTALDAKSTLSLHGVFR